MSIDPTAYIHPQAKIAEEVVIGPFSYIGKYVEIGRGTNIANSVTILGHTKIGEENRIFPHAAIGTDPQDLKFKGEESFLQIGDRNIIRESVTINTGTEYGGGHTIIGNDNIFMANSHIAHDCILENEIILGNNVLLAGHIKVESGAVLCGASDVHHFTTIGNLAFIGGLSRVVQDVPPFMIIEGNPSKIRGVNVVGMKRKGYTPEQIAAIKEAHRLLYRSKKIFQEALDELEEFAAQFDEVHVLLDFFNNQVKGKAGRAREALRK